MTPTGSKYGAAISRKDYVRVSAAAGIGSVLEWYDYSVLTAMSPVLQQVFFPPGNYAAQQLSFWSVYAVGYLFRPLGSLLFGHICDVHGRRLSLMYTLIMMAVPTVLIGCLPTYAHVGVAAPVLLSLLRLIQGIAVGGELGTAVVFMHELSPSGGKTKGGSIIFMGVTAGIMMGQIVALVVNAAIPIGALQHWGWRIPFLIAIVTTVAGMLLRYNMPESFEFEQDPVKAAYNKSAHSQHQSQHHLLQIDMQDANAPTCAGDLQLHRRDTSPDKPAPAAPALESMCLDQGLASDITPTNQGPGGAPAPTQPSCWSGCSSMFGHRPLKMLFRDHWRELLLLFWFETWSAANFYVFYGWMPSYIAVQWKVPTKLTLGMTLANMGLTLGLIPFAAHLADKGLPKLAATMGVLVGAAVCSIPMLLAVSSQSVVAAWLMQMFDLFLNASIFGWLPSIGSQLFPVHVRASGYNFAHTSAQSWIGGLTPVIISAIALRLQSAGVARGIYLVTGAYLTVCAIISLSVLVVMWRLHPYINKGAARSDSKAELQSALPQ